MNKSVYQPVLNKVFMTALALSVIHVANAELTSTSSVDKNGIAQMVVKNAQQTQLPPPQLGITPPVINDKLSMTVGKLDKSLTLYNYGSKPKRIKLTLLDLDDAGKVMPSTPSTLKNWTLINPTTFTIAASGYQTVRLSIRPPQNFAKQTYKAMLMIEQQIDNPLKYDANGKGIAVELGSRYGLPITVTVE